VKTVAGICLSLDRRADIAAENRVLSFASDGAGLDLEADAFDWYEFDQDVTVQRVGLITDDNHSVGCSPDRLVGDDGLLEIKAPFPHTQVEYWLSGELDERFRPQLQGQLYVSQRSWVDIVCWHDVLPKLVMRVEPDEGIHQGARPRTADLQQFYNTRDGKNLRYVCGAGAAGEIGIEGCAARQSGDYSVTKRPNSHGLACAANSPGNLYAGSSEHERAGSSSDRCRSLASRAA